MVLPTRRCAASSWRFRSSLSTVYHRPPKFSTARHHCTNPEPPALSAPSVAQAELEGQFVLSFKADAENVLTSEAEKLVQMVSYPNVLTGMLVSLNGLRVLRGRGG